MQKTAAQAYKVLQDVVQHTPPPMLQYVDWQRAHDDYNWIVTRNTLTRLGFKSHVASKLANEVTGSPRARLDKLIGDKHIVI
jgi:hypothetical protein